MTHFALQLLSPFLLLLVLILIVIRTKSSNHILSSLVQLFFTGQLGMASGAEAANEASRPLLLCLPTWVSISQARLQFWPGETAFMHHSAMQQ